MRRGAWVILIVCYAILSVAALGRSGYQLATKFSDAPVAYVLSAFSALVYVMATVALIRSSRAWTMVGWVTLIIEFVGVVVVGTLSLVDTALFPHDTVWSVYGRGYLFIPLVLPLVGMVYLYRRSRRGSQRNAPTS